MTTTNISEFGAREKLIAAKLLIEMCENGLPDDFWDDGVTPMLNTHSGNVFLTNSDYQVAMINPESGILESFYNTPYAGKEGFKDELIQEFNDEPGDWNIEDVEWLNDMGFISDEEFEGFKTNE